MNEIEPADLIRLLADIVVCPNCGEIKDYVEYEMCEACCLYYLTD